MIFKKCKLDKRTKQELKRAQKEKSRCAKTYKDWNDDEFNCGPLKFIWGIQYNGEITDNFNSLNDFEITYNRDTKKYLLFLETMNIFNDLESRKNYLRKHIFKKFENYILKNNLLDKNLDPHNLYWYNSGNLFEASDLTELYFKFKIFVKGYCSI